MKEDSLNHEAKEELDAAEEASLKTTVYMLSRELLENSTGHGLERIVRAKEWYRSVAWLFIFALGMVWFCYEIYLVITTYLAFDVTVSVRVTYTPKFEFPAVTVCNANMLKKASISNSKDYSSLGAIDANYQTTYCTSYQASCENFDPTYSPGNQTAMNNTMPPPGNDTAFPSPPPSFPPNNSTFNSTLPGSFNFTLPGGPNFTLPGGLNVKSPGGPNSTLPGAINFTGPPPQTPLQPPQPPPQPPQLGRKKRASLIDTSGSGGNTINSQQNGHPGGFRYDNRGFSGITSDTDFQAFVKQSQTQDFTDLSSLLKPTSKDLDNYGIQPDEFILQCSYDQTNCSYENFDRLQNSVYGNCYTFHPPSVTDAALITTHYGLQYVLTQSVCAQTTISRQPSPYPSNCTDGTDVDLLVDGQYTIWTNLYNTCGCQDQVVTNVSRCQISNTSQEICRQHVYYLYEEGQLGCSCPPSCYDVNYGTSVNSMNWPSDPYVYILGGRLMNDNPRAKALLDNDDLHQSIVNNIVRLHVYIKDPNVYSIVEQPAYEWQNLLADVGGLSGLCLGFSALSTFEFLEYFVDLFAIITKRLWMPQRHSEISPASSIMSIPLDHSHTDLVSHHGDTLIHAYSA